MLRNGKQQKPQQLRLEEFPLDQIKIDQITRDINGTNLLVAAQQQRKQKYLDKFYQLAYDFLKDKNGKIDLTNFYDDDRENTFLTIFYYAIHCFQGETELKAILNFIFAEREANREWEKYFLFTEDAKITSAFFTALEIENVVAMRCILQRNVDIMLTPNEDRILPPHYAAQQGKLKSLAFFIDELGEKYISGCENLAAVNILHTAIENEQVEAAKLIINKLPKGINTQDQYGYSPLHLAVIIKSESLVQLLLQKNADTSLSTTSTAQHSSKSALQLAAESGNEKIVLMLIEHGLKNTIATPNIDPARLFGDLNSLLGLTTHPVTDTSNLKNPHLQMLFALLSYAKNRIKDGTYKNYPMFAAAANTLVKLYDEKADAVYDRDSKLMAVWTVINNIINGIADPVANCTAREKAILQDGDLKELTRSLFPQEETLLRRTSPFKK